MNEQVLNRLLEMRFAVGLLGERSQHGWWPTAFFEQASTRFLEPVFPKTAVFATYHGVVEAAKRVHDERLSVGSFHLFRLPEEIEQDLYRVLGQELSSGESLATALNSESAIDALRNQAGAQEGAAPEGPILIGSLDDLRKADSVRAIATAYLQSFERGTQAFPYFDGKR